MTQKTIGEAIFEEFCRCHSVSFEKIKEKEEPTPDYRICLDGLVMIVEIKQIDDDANFTNHVGSRTVGAHVRAKINDARKQLKVAARDGVPAILLIYNNLDPFQLFGTESHDFISAMYGELTIVIDRNSKTVSDSFHGRNQSFREGKNDTFSAVGGIYKKQNDVTVEIYENAYAKYPIDYSRLPNFIRAKRIELT